VPSFINILIATTLGLSVAGLVVACLSVQAVNKKYREFELRAASLERQLTANLGKLLDFKQELGFFRSELAALRQSKSERREATQYVSPSSESSSRVRDITSGKASDAAIHDDSPSNTPVVDSDSSQRRSSETPPDRTGDQERGSNEREAETVESYSLDLVHRIYGDWCAALSKPEIPSSLDVKLAEYAFLEPPPPQGGSAIHVIRDTAKIGEFIRFSAFGADVGVVLPNPTAHFTPVVAHLFPGLTRDAYEVNGSGLIALSPVSVKRRTSSEWEAI
jgi:hypothetical protein